MVAKRKPAKAKNTADATKVTRITASDDTPKETVSTVTTAEKSKKVVKPPKTGEHESRRSPFRATADYFGGAWYELRQVIWPDRRSTWGMTGALIAFTLFFVLIILLSDWVSQNLFNLLLG